MTDAEALEARKLMNWWISRKRMRLRLVHFLGGRENVMQEVILRLLEYPPKPELEIKFSTHVLNMTHWTICLMTRHQARRILSIHQHEDLAHVELQDRDDGGQWQQDMEQRDIDAFFWSVFFEQCEGNDHLSRMAQCSWRLLQGETLEEIAPTFGVCRERVRQLAVKHLRRVQGQADRLKTALGEK